MMNRCEPCADKRRSENVHRVLVDKQGKSGGHRARADFKRSKLLCGYCGCWVIATSPRSPMHSSAGPARRRARPAAKPNDIRCEGRAGSDAAAEAARSRQLHHNARSPGQPGGKPVGHLARQGNDGEPGERHQQDAKRVRGPKTIEHKLEDQGSMAGVWLMSAT